MSLVTMSASLSRRITPLRNTIIYQRHMSSEPKFHTAKLHWESTIKTKRPIDADDTHVRYDDPDGCAWILHSVVRFLVLFRSFTMLTDLLLLFKPNKSNQTVVGAINFDFPSIRTLRK
jgi:hypothetical protein